MGGVILGRYTPRGAARKKARKRTSGARTKNGVSLNGVYPSSRSMRSAPIKPMLPIRQMYSSFRSMSDNTKRSSTRYRKARISVPDL